MVRLFVAILPMIVLLVGCAAPPLLSPLRTSGTVVRPDGRGVDDLIRLSWELGARADVAVELIAQDGTSYVLRERGTRAPDTYELRFDGTVPSAEGGRRVVPDGSYTVQVAAEDPGGRREVRSAGVTVVDADTTPVAVVDLQTDLDSFSPNGDGEQDDLRITYRLTKAAESTVYATDQSGAYFAIDPWRKRRATLQSHQWDGTTGGRLSGGKLLADGTYTVHVEARDAAGNTASAQRTVVLRNGGTPRLEITDVRFSPIAVILGGTLDVRITVRNVGTTAIRSWGPPPGHTYSAPEESFATIRDPKDAAKPAFYERQGVWRVGVTWQNAPQPFPLRWGLFPPTKRPDGTEDWDARMLRPGESVTVDGHIRLFVKEDSRQVRLSAGVIQEGVGFPGGRVGEQVVQVGW